MFTKYLIQILSFTLFMYQYESSIIKLLECPLPTEAFCKLANFTHFDDDIIYYTAFLQPTTIPSCSTNDDLLELKREGNAFYLDTKTSIYSFNLCLKYKDDPLEHVARVIYIGFLLQNSTPSLIQGDFWHLDYLVSLPLAENINLLPRYNTVALKNGENCDGTIINLGKLVPKGYDKELSVLSFSSSDHIISDSKIASFCTCPFHSDCKYMTDFTNFLATAPIKGPYLTNIIMDCVYGIKCQISIPGDYEGISGIFTCASQCTENLVSSNVNQVQEKDQFIVDDSVYSKDKQTSQYQICWQLMNPHKGSPVSIGTIYAHNLYIGNTYVAPFGKQILLANRFNVCSDGIFMLFEFTPDNSLWKVVSKFSDDDILSIDIIFSPDYIYELRYCNNCEEHVKCVDDSRESSALVSNILLSGITKYTNFTCILGKLCVVILPAINQSPISQNASLDIKLGNILITQECGKPLNQLKFIQNHGLISVFQTSSADGKKSNLMAEYLISNKKVPNYAVSSLLYICYCQNTSKTCSARDYTIQVGTLFFRDSTKQDCWSGNTCIFSLNGDYSQRNVVLRHACHINSSEIIFFGGEKFPKFVKTYTINGQIKTQFYARLTDDIMNNSMLKICSLDSSLVLGEILIKSFFLVPNSFIVDSYQKVVFKAGELVTGKQSLLLMNKGKTTSILSFNDSNFNMSLDISSGVYQVYWCVVDQFTLCNDVIDFRLQIATVYVSGLMSIQKRIDCMAGVDCRFELSVSKYFTRGNTFLQTQITPFNIVASIVNDCNRILPSTMFIFHHSATNSITLNEVDDEIASYNYIMEFIGKFHFEIKPNKYKICINRGTKYSSVSGLYITVQGVFDSRYPVLVHSGRPFNLSIRGFKIPKTDLHGFLTDSDYGCNRIDVNVLNIRMSESPNFVYSALGLVNFIWSDVTITCIRHAFKNKLTLCLCWLSDCKNDIDYSMSRVKLFLSCPGYDEGIRRIIVSSSFDLTIDSAIPVLSSSVVIKSTRLAGDKLVQLYTGYSTQEIPDLLHIRLSERKRAFPLDYNSSHESSKYSQAKYEIITTRVFDNATLYYCIGYQCNSLNDFKTPIFEVIIQGPTFNHYIAEPDKLQIVNVPNNPILTHFDKFLIVYEDIDCRRALFHNGMIISNTMNYINAKSYRYMFQDTLKSVFQLSNSGLSSLGLVIYSSNSTIKRNTICYCPYAAKLSCDRASDFSAVVGSISPLEELASGDSDDQNYCNYGLNLNSNFVVSGVIGGKNEYTSVSLGDFLVSQDEVDGVLNEYFGSIHKGYALNYELDIYQECDKNYSTECQNTRHFQILRPGIFSNQLFVLKVNSPNELTIYGRDLDKYHYTSISIISSFNLCSETNNSSLVKSRLNLYYSMAPTKLVYQNITLLHVGYFKLCLFDPTAQSQPDTNSFGLNNAPGQGELGDKVGKWIDAGTIAVKDFYRIPLANDLDLGIIKKNGAEKTVFSCLSHNGIYLYNGITMCYRGDYLGNLSSSCLNVQLHISLKPWFYCTVRRRSKEYISNNNHKYTNIENLILLDSECIIVLDVTEGVSISQPKEYLHNLKAPNHMQVIDDLLIVSCEAGIYASSFTPPLNFTLISKISVKSFSIVHAPITPSEGGPGGASGENIPPEYYIYAIDYEGTLAMYSLEINVLATPVYSFTHVSNYKGLYGPVAITSIIVLGTVLTFVGEESTGRIVALRCSGNNIQLYKDIDFVGTVTEIDCLGGYLSVTGYQQGLYGLSPFTIMRLLQSLTRIEFSYPIPETLQSGQEYSFKPIISGDKVEFISENFFKNNSKNANPKLNDLNKPSMFGLEIDPQTFVLGGVLMATGINTLRLVGGNLFGYAVRLFTFTATCNSGFGWSEVHGICIECPSGTYRGSEYTFTCLDCLEIKPNSTTMFKGSTSAHDCVCNPGFYLSERSCVRCEGGRFKSVPGDAACIQQCPKNMTSSVEGAKSLEELDCKCLPGFYLHTGSAQILASHDFTPALAPDSTDASISSHLPCKIGYYCLGGSFGPVKCPVNTTTISQGSPSSSHCLCSPGYELKADPHANLRLSGALNARVGSSSSSKCVACKRSHYKSEVGDFACKLCQGDLVGDFQPSWYNMLLFAGKRGATDPKECKLCVSGYYYESQACTACPSSSYCLGLSLGPVFCGQNSLARDFRSNDAMHCVCNKFFSYTARSPIDNSIICRHCASNWGYSLDAPCIPLFEQVSASPSGILYNSRGYYLPQNPTQKNNSAQIDSAQGGFKGQGDATRSFSCQLLALEGIIGSFDGWYHLKVYREGFAECKKTCSDFQFCRGFIYSKNDNKYASLIYSSESTSKILYSPCRLYIYSFFSTGFTDFSAITAVITISKHQKESGTYELGLPIACSLQLPLPREIVPLPCPSNHYCPEATPPTKCPVNSITLPPYYASSADDCLCLEGYQGFIELANRECKPCPLGMYKSSVGNELCLRCPESLTTFMSGSVSLHDCGCPPGYFAQKAVFRDSPGSLSAYPRPLGAQDEGFVCEKCLSGNYCPGGFIDQDTLKGGLLKEELKSGLIGRGILNEKVKGGAFHSIANNCPEGSQILKTTHLPTNVKQCTCLAGYERSAIGCIKCSPGTFKEFHDDSSCAGRCPQSATSFFGAISKSQCFCQYGLYMKFINSAGGNDYGLFKGECTKCPKGAICLGGLDLWFVDRLSQDGSFTHIPYYAHIQPVALSGYWAQFLQDNSRVFHPCSNTRACSGGLVRCSRGSDGYLCDSCIKGYIKRFFSDICRPWKGWYHELALMAIVSALKLLLALAISLYLCSGVLRIFLFSVLALGFNSRNVNNAAVQFFFNCAAHSFSWPVKQLVISRKTMHQSSAMPSAALPPAQRMLLTNPFTALVIPLVEYLALFRCPQVRGILLLINLPGLILNLGQMAPCVTSPLYGVPVYIHRPSLECSLKVQIFSVFTIAAVMYLYYSATKNVSFFSDGLRSPYWHALSTLRLLIVILASIVRFTIHPFSHNTNHSTDFLHSQSDTIYFAIQLVWMLLYFYLKPYESVRFDKMELAGILGNIITSSALQASAYYDIKYINYIPIAAFTLELLVLLKCLAFSSTKFRQYFIFNDSSKHDVIYFDFSKLPGEDSTIGNLLKIDPEGVLYADELYYNYRGGCHTEPITDLQPSSPIKQPVSEHPVSQPIIVQAPQFTQDANASDTADATRLGSGDSKDFITYTCDGEDLADRLTVKRMKLDPNVAEKMGPDELIVYIINLLKKDRGVRSLQWSDDVLDFNLK